MLVARRLRDEVSRLHLDQGHGVGGGAGFEDRAGHLVGLHRSVGPAASRIGDRHRVEQPLGVVVHGVLEDGAARTQLDDLAEVHHAHTVSDSLHHGEVVADEQVRQSHLFLQIHHQVDDLRLDRDVQRGHRFIGDHQLGPQRQGSGDADALPLTSGELVRVLPHVVGRHADPSQEIGDHVIDLTLGHGSMDLERLGDRLAHGAAGIQAGEGVLEDDLRLAPVGPQRPGPEARDVGAVEPDGAAGRIEQADDQVRQRRFATAALADHRQRLASVDMQADLLHGVHAGAMTGREMLGERFDLDDRLGLCGTVLRHESDSPSLSAPAAAAAASASGSISSKRCGASTPAIDPSRGTAASSDCV